MIRKKKRLTPDVAITRNFDEGQAVLEGLKLINAENLINEQDVVVITPNWVNDKKQHEKSGIVVGPQTLQTIIQFVKGRNPKRIVLACGSGGGDTPQVMTNVGYDKIIQQEGVEFIDLNVGPYMDLPINYDIFPSTKINQLLNETTVLLSFTQLKHHEEATMSASIKNMALSWPPTEIHGTPKKDLGIHTHLHNFIRAMAEQVPIDLAIVSANPVMVGTGPTKGTARHTGLVITGTDAVAVDTIGARFLGFKPQGVNYLFQCAEKQIGEHDLGKMKLVGLTIQEAEKFFSEAVYGEQVIVDAN